MRTKIIYGDGLPRHGRQGVRERLTNTLRLSVNEREQLGLSLPKEVTLKVHLDDLSSEAEGSAYDSENGPEIMVNTLETLLNGGQPWQSTRAGCILGYFNDSRTLLNMPEEMVVLEFIRDPKRTLEGFIKESGREKYDEFVRKLAILGVDYERSYLNLAKSSADFRREVLGALLGFGLEYPAEQVLSNLRHELDHADFYSTTLHRGFASKDRKIGGLNKKVLEKGETSRECAEMNMDILKILSELSVLKEARAQFFSYCRPWGIRKKAREAAPLIVCNVDGNYIRRAYASPILKALTIRSRCDGEINKPTSEFINFAFGKYVEVEDYVSRVPGLDVGVVKRILYEEIPAWQRKFRDNLEGSANALAIAFEENPSMIRIANDAQSFDEYLGICLGEKI